MENQHRKIVGYRELTQADIDLMNRIKAKGREFLELVEEVDLRAEAQYSHQHDIERLDKADPYMWLQMAKMDIQTGTMALVRAVAQPTDC